MVKGKLKIIWDDEAKVALRSIYDYIKYRESVGVATRIRNEIVRQIKALGRFPKKFAKEPHLMNAPGDFRFKVIWSYKIIYEVTLEYILVLDIFHTSRDPSGIN